MLYNSDSYEYKNIHKYLIVCEHISFVSKWLVWDLFVFLALLCCLVAISAFFFFISPFILSSECVEVKQRYILNINGVCCPLCGKINNIFTTQQSSFLSFTVFSGLFI